MTKKYAILVVAMEEGVPLSTTISKSIINDEGVLYTQVQTEDKFDNMDLVELISDGMRGIKKRLLQPLELSKLTKDGSGPDSH